MSLIFTIKRSDNAQYYFILSADGETILQSETYTQKSACDNGINSLRQHATNRDNFELNSARNGQYYFNIKADNGQVVGTSVMFDGEDARLTAVQQCQQADKAQIKEA